MATPMAPPQSRNSWGLWAWQTAAWVVDVLVQASTATSSMLVKLPLLGPWLERSYWPEYLYGTLYAVYSVFLQKLHMYHLDHIDFVGGPAKGLTAIVTGPTSGIGRETAAALARRGARVVLACRSISKGQALKKEIEEDCATKGFAPPELDVMQLDLASLKSVRGFCAAWNATGRELHILINNAGIYSLLAPRDETVDGFEAHMGCNHLGHFLLTMSLLPSLKRGAAKKSKFGARIVSVSSSVHMMAPRGISLSDPHLRQPGHYNYELAYGQSKLAQILFTRELRRRLGQDSPVQAISVHPGIVLTDVVRALPAWVQRAYIIILGVVLLTPSEGARASVYCATSPNAPAEAAKSDGYINANCMPLLPSRAARDDTAALWLWRWSCRQVDLPAELDVPQP